MNVTKEVIYKNSYLKLVRTKKEININNYFQTRLKLAKSLY
jgi:hypothetical protein